MADDDYETKTPTIGAMIVREYNDFPSNFRSTATLDAVMKRYQIPGIYGVDTRRLTRTIRNGGSQPALLTRADLPLEDGIKALANAEIPQDAVSRVSCDAPWISPCAEPRFHVVAIDCGMKQNIVRSLNARGCKVTIVPWNTPAVEIQRLYPDGIFLSNGPGSCRCSGSGPDREASAW